MGGNRLHNDSLRDLVGLLRRNWRGIVLAAAVSAGVVLAATTLRPQGETDTIQVLQVNFGVKTDPVTLKPVPVIAQGKLQEVLNDRGFLAEVARRAGVDVGAVQPPVVIVSGLKTQIKITGEDGATALRVAESLRDVLQEQHLNTYYDIAREQAAVMEDKLGSLKRQLDMMEANLAAGSVNKDLWKLWKETFDQYYDMRIALKKPEAPVITIESSNATPPSAHRKDFRTLGLKLFTASLFGMVAGVFLILLRHEMVSTRAGSATVGADTR